MRNASINQPKSYHHPQFKSGLTKQMLAEIKHCDAMLISKEIEKYGVKTDFKGDKVVAWCILKCVEIVDSLNKKYNLSLDLPKAVFVEDFSKLKNVEKSILAFCNFSRERLHLDSKKVTGENTLLINNFGEKNFWDDIDEIADVNFATNVSATDFFLDMFLHEFSHSMHQGQILLYDAQEKPYLKQFKSVLGKIIKANLCNYAKTSPLETVACDLSKRLIDSLDKNSLQVISDPIKNSPYRRVNCFRQLLLKENESKADLLNKYITNFWNGQFNV